VNSIYGAALGGRAASRFSFYLTLQLTSVLAPGLVIGAELALLIVKAETRNPGSELHSLVQDIAGLHGAGLFLGTVVALAACYIVGHICRDIAFWLLGVLERIKIRRGAPAGQGETGDARNPRRVSIRGEESILAQVRALVGDQVTDACVELHPVLRLLDASQHPLAGLGDVVGGGHLYSGELEAFAYCKLWLRRCAPELSVDHLEIEINILAATVTPVLLAASVAAVWSSYPLVWVIVGLPVALAIDLVLLRNAANLRKTERWEAVRNLVEDHIMRMATSRYGAVAGQGMGLATETPQLGVPLTGNAGDQATIPH
jgi:hypothetical protein